MMQKAQKKTMRKLRNESDYIDALYLASRLGYVTVYTLSIIFDRRNPVELIAKYETKARKLLCRAEDRGWLKQARLEHIACFALTAAGAQKLKEAKGLEKAPEPTLSTLRFKRTHTLEEVKRCKHRLAADLTSMVFGRNAALTFFERECLQNRETIKEEFQLHKIPDGLFFNKDKTLGISIEVDKSRRSLADWRTLFAAIRLDTCNSSMSIAATLMICSKETKNGVINHFKREFEIKNHAKFQDYDVLEFDSESEGAECSTSVKSGVPGIARVIVIELDFKRVLDWTPALYDAKNTGVGELIEELLAVA